MLNILIKMAPRKASSKKMVLVGAGFFNSLGSAISKGVKGAIKGVKGVNQFAKDTGLIGTVAGLTGNPNAYMASRALGYGRGKGRKAPARRR